MVLFWISMPWLKKWLKYTVSHHIRRSKIQGQPIWDGLKQLIDLFYEVCRGFREDFFFIHLLEGVILIDPVFSCMRHDIKLSLNNFKGISVRTLPRKISFSKQGSFKHWIRETICFLQNDCKKLHCWGHGRKKIKKQWWNAQLELCDLPFYLNCSISCSSSSKLDKFQIGTLIFYMVTECFQIPCISEIEEWTDVQ